MRHRGAKDFFATEASLCEAYVASTSGQGWIVYPETAGFDLLMVREDTGHQLGIEAKLSLNAKVVEQILPGDSTYGGFYEEGPDWRAVLVPEIGGACGIAQLLEIVGVMVFKPRRRVGRFVGGTWAKEWEFPISASRYECEWHDWNPKERCALPEIVPRVAAGVPSPIQLTPWKIGALKVLAMIEVDGFVTRTHVRSCGVDPRRFCASDGWLRPAGAGKWTRGNLPAFEDQHPEAFSQLLNEARAKREAETA